MSHSSVEGKLTLNNISNIFAEDFIQQAENCELIGCSVENYGLGYEGNGYVKFTNSIGDGINYSINGEEKYSDITIRYSQGSEADQTLSLFVNSKFVQKVNFPSTDEWDTSWSSVKVPVYLSEQNKKAYFERRAQGESARKGKKGITRQFSAYINTTGKAVFFLRRQLWKTLRHIR